MALSVQDSLQGFLKALDDRLEHEKGLPPANPEEKATTQNQTRSPKAFQREEASLLLVDRRTRRQVCEACTHSSPSLNANFYSNVLREEVREHLCQDKNPNCRRGQSTSPHTDAPTDE